MRILAIDIGTGTQDVLLFDTSLAITNCPKMVMPSPTATLARRIATATSRRQPLLFTGFTMGGGPSKWALKRHLDAGLKAFATPNAARTFDDDLDELRQMGLVPISQEKARTTKETVLDLKDVDFPAISSAFSAMGVEPGFDAIAVAVQDHGAAPSGISDRAFRFGHMVERLRDSPDLLAFCYAREEVPDYLTRMQGVAASLPDNVPLLIMDTGFAAALGASEDSAVARRRDRVIVNLGNSHTIAFHLHGTRVLGMFEQHTHGLDSAQLAGLIEALTTGSLTNEQVFNEGGHGAVVLEKHEGRHLVVGVGPQRGKLAASGLRIHLAVPHGDMMIAGCFGLVRAFALKHPEVKEEILAALAREET